MSTDSHTQSSLPYHEPSIVTILAQASFLILSNLLNHVVNNLLYCGLIGQILVGVAWGTPGARILSLEAESTIVQLGYIGLILIVYEGGLSTDFRSLKANAFLSATVAVTGIGVPICMSFVLRALVGASDLECFAAGAALSSTSLGTTFTVLRSSGLVNSRLSIVLASAAMLDDVVGLVMVQIVANLGAAGGSIPAATIVRPLMVSLAFAVLTPVMCLFIVKPATLALRAYRQKHKGSFVDRALCSRGTAVIVHTLFLVSMVTASSDAGTSNLFAAYITGAVINWWDHEVQPHAPATQGDADASGQAIYHQYHEPVVQRVLQPFFFGSVGFSIPITRMFSGSVVWKGVVYAVLMCIGKMACGVWLMRFPGLKTRITCCFTKAKKAEERYEMPPEPNDVAERENDESDEAGEREHNTASASMPDNSEAMQQAAASTSSATTPDPAKPVSLYPAAMLGFAMVARGKIGFLISAIAQSRGVFGADENTGDSSEIFLIVTWAIVLCTVLRPLCTGLLVRRVKALEEERGGNTSSANTTSSEGPGSGTRTRTDTVLGVWGP